MTSNFAACEEFFILVVEGHIISAALTLFEMKSIEVKPSEKFFPEKSTNLAPTERRNMLLMACMEVVRSYVDVTYEKKSYERNKEGEDGVHDYGCDILNLGLFYMEFVHAIHDGDGNRIIRCWRYLLLIFKICGRKNYSIKAFTLLSQYSFSYHQD